MSQKVLLTKSAQSVINNGTQCRKMVPWSVKSYITVSLPPPRRLVCAQDYKKQNKKLPDGSQPEGEWARGQEGTLHLVHIRIKGWIQGFKKNH